MEYCMKSRGDTTKRLKQYVNDMNRQPVQNGDDEEWGKVLSLKASVVTQSDFLAKEVGGVRMAVAALRQGVIRQRGSLPLDGRRISLIRGLLPDAVCAAAIDLANYGASLLFTKDPILPSKQVGPHKSALEAEKEIVFGTLADVVEGRPLIFSSQSQKEMDIDKVVLFPSGSADKKKADGSLSPNKRHTCDARMSEFCHQLATMALNCPGVGITLQKFDINAAFKNVLANLADVPLLASEIPSSSPSSLEKEVMVSSTLVFGLADSPAYFQVAAASLCSALNQVQPDNPQENGGFNNFYRVHVDDFVSATLNFGDAPEIAEWSFNQIGPLIMGDNFIIQEKLKEEGGPKTRLKFWGFIVDVSEVPQKGVNGIHLSIPEDKVEKTRRVLEKISLEDIAFRRVLLKDMQVLQGMGVYVSVGCPAVTQILARLFAMCASTSTMWVSPEFDVDRKWEEFAGAVISFHLLLEDASHDHFTTRILHVLSPRELRESGSSIYYLGSDATGYQASTGKSGVWAAVDYRNKIWIAQEVEETMDLIRDRSGGDFEGDESRVVYAELIPVVVLAILVGESWKNQSVIIPIDNHNAVCAISKGYSKNVHVQYLLDILFRILTIHNINLKTLWTHTESNDFMDAVSREFHLKSANELQTLVDSFVPGLRRVDASSTFKFLRLEGNKSLVARLLPGESSYCLAQVLADRWDAALKLAKAASSVSQPDIELGSILEFNPSVNPMIRAGLKKGFLKGLLGGVSKELGRVLEPQFSATEMELVGPADGQFSKSPLSSVRLAIFNVHHSEEEIRSQTVHEFTSVVLPVSSPQVVVWVLYTTFMNKQAGGLKDWDREMEKSGYSRLLPINPNGLQETIEKINMRDLNGGFELHRLLLWYEKSDMAAALGPPMKLATSWVPFKGWPEFLDDTHMIDNSLWQRGTFTSSSEAYDGENSNVVGWIQIDSVQGELQEGCLVKVDGRWWVLLQLKLGDICSLGADARGWKAWECPITSIEATKGKRYRVYGYPLIGPLDTLSLAASGSSKRASFAPWTNDGSKADRGCDFFEQEGSSRFNEATKRHHWAYTVSQKE